MGFFSTGLSTNGPQHQTKAVKGQDCKTLATTGAIKRPLPCPREEVRKTEHILQSQKKKKKRSKKKRKKTRTKNREEKKGN